MPGKDGLTASRGPIPFGCDARAKKITIGCFYKGTCFPMPLVLPTLDAWRKKKAGMTDILLEGVLAGHSLREQAINRKSQLDNWEELIKDTYNPADTDGGTARLQRLQLYTTRLGITGEPEWRMEQWARWWYQNVCCLIKLGELRDGNDNGWHITGPAKLLRPLLALVHKDPGVKGGWIVQIDHDPFDPEDRQKNVHTSSFVARPKK